ncbi:MAG TPA: Gfo/Idh/MocA family oxidoreductase [Solirubrobacteraceae bacterium]|nr:Gfo/Idh/MocA family oxidoreductase [Solirubrobacteraceae bacterium]
MTRLGVVGYGLAGQVFHAPYIDAVDGLEVGVIVTGNAERAARARERHPGASVVASVDQAWEADAVVIATPNRFHAPLALQAIERGVPVVVDKPFAVTAADARRVHEAAERAGVPLTVFQNRRWDSDFVTLRRLLEAGALGRVLRFESRFERFRPEIKAGWRELAAEDEGGGQLLDLGAHLIDQALVLFGRPVRVYAEVERRREGAGVEDDVFLALEHPGGQRSHLWMSAIAAAAGPRMVVNGTLGGLVVDELDPQERQLLDGMRIGDEGFGQAPPARLVDAAGSRPQPLAAGDYRGFYAAVRDWLAGDGPAPVDPADSVAALEVIEAARRSAADRAVVAP